MCRHDFPVNPPVYSIPLFWLQIHQERGDLLMNKGVEESSMDS